MITKSDPRRSFLCDECPSQPQLINQKPALGGDLVIEQHRCLICFMGLPIDTGAAPRAGGVCHRLNQSAACSKATASLADIKVLQIAAIAKRPIGGVINPIHHADRLATGVAREEAARWCGGVYHAGKGGACDLPWQGGFIKYQIGLPKWVPVVKVGGGEGVECDHDFVLPIAHSLVKAAPHHESPI
jgi:hypothetical protein